MAKSDEYPPVSRAILEHLGLWLAGARTLPKNHDTLVRMYSSIRPTDSVVR
ncbi:MAG: hypothetical protein V1766_03225 [Pseudomonadota bacterium]